MSKRIENIINELIEQYLEDDRHNRPWIIGFSGGKDSTVLLTLVWLALLKIKEENPKATFKRQVYVVCNDTMVENPVIEEYLCDVLQSVANYKNAA
jgi:DNA sulfur modification protein DndC